MPKIIGKSLSEHREQVRARVFDVLRHQLYERGFDAITLASVAAEAKLGRTAIYNHFPDKESLLVAFVEDEARAQDLRVARRGGADLRRDRCGARVAVESEGRHLGRGRGSEPAQRVGRGPLEGLAGDHGVLPGDRLGGGQHVGDAALSAPSRAGS